MGGLILKASGVPQAPKWSMSRHRSWGICTNLLSVNGAITQPGILHLIMLKAYSQPGLAPISMHSDIQGMILLIKMCTVIGNSSPTEAVRGSGRDGYISLLFPAFVV